ITLCNAASLISYGPENSRCGPPSRTSKRCATTGWPIPTSGCCSAVAYRVQVAWRWAAWSVLKIWVKTLVIKEGRNYGQEHVQTPHVRADRGHRGWRHGVGRRRTGRTDRECRALSTSGGSAAHPVEPSVLGSNL